MPKTSGSDVTRPRGKMKQSTFEVARKLSYLMVQKLIVPSIQLGLMDMTEVSQIIERGVVAGLSRKASSNELIAKHLSRSRRWFQETLREAKAVESPKREVKPEQPDPNVGAAYQFMLEVLEAFISQHPESMGVEQLRRKMDIPIWHFGDKELERRLKLYSELGVLKLVDNTEGVPRYRSTSRMVDGLEGTEALDKLSLRISWILPLALTYCEGSGEFIGVAAGLSPTAIERARERLRAVTAEIIADAVEETCKSDDFDVKNVQTRLVVAFGKIEDPD